MLEMVSAGFRRVLSAGLVGASVALSGLGLALAQQNQPFVPREGQAGKDVVWVPTPPALVEKMLDMAKLTPQDFVMDLGSGDGRNIIAAAKRGVRGLGVEYNPDMVTLSRKLAADAGVADRAQFVEGDMFAADLSRATVLALFLLPDNLDKLREKFLALPAGTRMVLNTFAIPNWEPDTTEVLTGDCRAWCTSLLYLVPARVAGRWRFGTGELVLDQRLQFVEGLWTENGRTEKVVGRLRGQAIELTAGGTRYVGSVNANAIEGANGSWRATRLQ